MQVVAPLRCAATSAPGTCAGASVARRHRLVRTVRCCAAAVNGTAPGDDVNVAAVVIGAAASNVQHIMSTTLVRNRLYLPICVLTAGRVATVHR